MAADGIYKKALALVLLFSSATTLQAQQTGELITIDQHATEDQYIAGRSVHVLSTIDGDLVVAAQHIDVKENISGDLIAAGERLTVRGTVGDDIRAAARILSIYGQVVDDTILAGETVTIAADTTIGGRLWVAGRNVEVDGKVSSEMRAIAQHISIGGIIQGDVSLIAANIELLPGAEIKGNLVYRSESEISISPDANVIGTIQRKALDTADVSDSTTFPFVLLFLLSVLLTISVIYWLFPALTKETSLSIQREPFKSLGIGLSVFLVWPILAILLTVTVFGIPLGLMLLAVYPVFLVFGFAVGVYMLSNLVLNLLKGGARITEGWRLLGVALALIAIMVVQFIPFAGVFIVLFIVLSGLGALSIAMFQRFRQL